MKLIKQKDKWKKLSVFCHYYWQIELYNSMVEKEGTEGEQEAKKAYKAAREDSNSFIEAVVSDKASSALINKVMQFLNNDPLVFHDAT